MKFAAHMQYLLQFNPRSEPLPVHAPQTPMPVRTLLDVPAYTLKPMEKVQIGEIHFNFFPVRHPVESYALRAECDGKVFVYTGDTNLVDGLDEFAKNADTLLADSGLLSADWKDYIRMAKGREQFDLILLDPPYTEGLLDEILRALVEADLPAANAILICESDEKGIPAPLEGYRQKLHRYGKSYVSVYRREEEEV